MHQVAPARRTQNCAKFKALSTAAAILSHFRMILHESLTTSSPSTNQPNCHVLHHIQNRKKVLQKKSWNNPEEKLTIYQNHSTLVWSEHRSALGNIFSDPNFQPFFSRDIFLCVWRYSKSCDAEFFGESLENQKLVPLSAICSGCHNGFVRLWILYLSAVKVCIFGSKFLPSCGSGTSLSLVPPIRDLYRGGSTMGGTSNGSWENRKATQSTVPRCPPWVAKQRPGTTKSSSS